MDLSPDQHALLKELIDANEPGVALDMLSEILQAGAATLDVDTAREATRLAGSA